MSALAASPARLTARAFLSWDPPDGRRYELVDGVPRAIAPASPVHGLLQGRLAALTTNHFDRARPGCSLVVAPCVIPRRPLIHDFRIPELGVTCVPVRPGQTGLAEPVLLIEIMSPSDVAETWSNVRAYTSIDSLQEILVLHSTRVGAELLRRDQLGDRPDAPELIEDGALTLTSIGLRVALSEIYSRSSL